MLTQDDENAIDNLFERLRNAERNSGPRDVEAEALIAQRLRENPAAAYYMAQTIIVQEAALREQQAQLEQAQNRDRGGFLGGIFGGDQPQRREEPMRSEEPQRRRGPWDRGANAGGGGFLAGAAQTALGVTGGVLLGSAIAGMFNTPAMAEEAPVDDAQDAGADEGLDDGGGDWGGEDFDMGGDF